MNSSPLNPADNQLSVSPLPFTQIPSSSKLFLDYLYDSKALEMFYPSRTSASFIDSVFSNVPSVIRHRHERDQVANALLEQNQRLGCSEKTLQNIELLRDPSTVAVVTGQQAGLFGGPLYTIYKALTAIKLSEELNLKGQKAIPVFWIASEDHDYEEVSYLQIIGHDGHPSKIKYIASGNVGSSSVGHLSIDSNISNPLTELFASLPQSEFIKELEKDLRSAYREDVGFAKAFGQLISNLFTQYGLVLLDPLDIKLKQIAAPIFEQAINKSAEIAQALVSRSQELQSQGYHAQVYTNADMVTFFILENGERNALRYQEGNFTLKHHDTKRTKLELLEQLKGNPSSFSPSVMLRPIVQDYLLPTVAYIGGPAEVAYFAQISSIYPFFPVNFPVILARNSFTIAPNRDGNLLKKWDLEFTDLFIGLEGVKRKVLENQLDQETIKIFDETTSIFQTQLEKLQNSLLKIDPTLAEALKGGKEKIFYQITNLHTRFINNNAKREETLVRQIERTFNLLYTNKNLQERELNIYHFLSRYGYKFIDLLYKNIDPESKNHFVLHI